MNQGRVWCVVSPTVGLPLLLGSVAATSLIVHACVMTNTTWMSNYWQGRARVATSDAGAAQPVASANPAAPAFTLSIAPVAGAPGKSETSFVVTVAPNPAASVQAAADPAEGEAAPVALAASDPR